MKNVLRTIEETEGVGLADTVKRLFLLPDPLARYLKLTVYYVHTTVHSVEAEPYPASRVSFNPPTHLSRKIEGDFVRRVEAQWPHR